MPRKIRCPMATGDGATARGHTTTAGGSSAALPSELRTPEGIRVRVHVFPPDAAFSSDVRKVWDSLVVDRLDAATFRADVEKKLRRWYPMATIHTQDDFAAM